jgi:hypothetical protein
LDPSERPTFAGCLESFRGKAFPEVFYTFLHDFVINVNEVTSLSAPPPYPSPSPTPGPATLSSAPGPGSLARMRTGLLSTVSAGGSTASGAVPGATYSSGTTNNPADKIPDSTSVLKTDSDEKIEIVWNEWPEVLQALEGHLLGGGPGSKVGSDGQDEGVGIEGTAKGVRTASDVRAFNHIEMYVWKCLTLRLSRCFQLDCKYQGGLLPRLRIRLMKAGPLCIGVRIPTRTLTS